MTRPTGMPTSSPSFLLDPLEDEGDVWVVLVALLNMKVGPVSVLPSETRKRVKLAGDPWVLLRKLWVMLMIRLPWVSGASSLKTDDSLAVSSSGLSKYESQIVSVELASKMEVSHCTVTRAISLG